MSGDIEQDKCDFCKQIKPVQRFYIRVNDNACDSIIIRYCKDHEPVQEQQIKELERENASHIEPMLKASGKIKKLEDAVENALAIKDIWLIKEENCPPEHIGEAQALAGMETGFKQALKK